MLLQTWSRTREVRDLAQAEGGEIAITARSLDGELRIQVSNPGVIDRPGRAPSTGVGLHNAPSACA